MNREELRIRTQLTINQCHLADVRDARTAGHGTRRQLDREERKLKLERARLNQQLRELRGDT